MHYLFKIFIIRMTISRSGGTQLASEGGQYYESLLFAPASNSINRFLFFSYILFAYLFLEGVLKQE